jgi:hypothetical protein
LIGFDGRQGLLGKCTSSIDKSGSTVWKTSFISGKIVKGEKKADKPAVVKDIIAANATATSRRASKRQKEREAERSFKR